MNYQLKAHAAVENIINDLSDRHGIGQEWEVIDDDIKEAIKRQWIEIILTEFMDEG